MGGPRPWPYTLVGLFTPFTRNMVPGGPNTCYREAVMACREAIFAITPVKNIRLVVSWAPLGMHFMIKLSNVYSWVDLVHNEVPGIARGCR